MAIKALPKGTRQAQDLEGYEKLDIDELERILDEPAEDPIAKAKAEAEEAARKEQEEKEADPADSPPEDEEKEAEPVEAEEEEAEADEADEKEEEEPQEEIKEEVEETSIDKRIRLLERRLELEALERVKESEARQRAELLASKQAGRAGYLAKQLEQSPPKAQPAKAEADDDGDPWSEEVKAKETRQEQQEPTPATHQAWEEDRAELVKMAINDEGSEFTKRHAHELEDMPKEFLERLREQMEEEAAPYAEEFKTSSIKTVRKLARSLMNSAFATTRIEFADKVVENAQKEVATRKAESVEKSKRRKAKAAISGSGGKATKKSSAPKVYEDMDLEELEAEMIKEFGDDYRLGSAKDARGGL